MKVRGIRGATTVHMNEEKVILEATRELLQKIISENQLHPREICSVFITATPDLTATFPALAIRLMPGWELVPLMCASEIDVPGALSHCIRLLLHVNTTLEPEAIVHPYLRDAKVLRPDLVR